MSIGESKFQELEKRCNALHEVSEKYKIQAQERFHNYDKMIGEMLGSKQALNDSIKAQVAQIKILAARVEVIAKEAESQKKSAAGMADINGLKKLIADLTKRIEVVERKK